MELKKFVFVVVRSVGERTTEACIDSIKMQGFDSEDIEIVSEHPFSSALRSSLEAGLKKGKPWTLIIDADVILSPGSIKNLLQSAEAKDGKVCEVQGLVFDKFFNCFRAAGNHMYRTSLIKEVLSCVSHDGKLIRPETYALELMTALGYPWYNLPTIVGVHDFEQWNEDIFRKFYLQSHKNIPQALRLVELWRDKSDFDDDFRVGIEGFCFGLKHRPSIFVNSKDTDIVGAFKDIDIPEKAHPFCHSSSIDYARKLIEREIEKDEIDVYGYPVSPGELTFGDKNIAPYNMRLFALKKHLAKHGVIRSIVYTVGASTYKLGEALKKFSGVKI